MRDLKCPDWEKTDWEKKVGLVYQKKQQKNGKHTAYQEITFLFHTVINNVSPFPKLNQSELLVSSSFRKR